MKDTSEMKRTEGMRAFQQRNRNAFHRPVPGAFHTHQMLLNSFSQWGNSISWMPCHSAWYLLWWSQSGEYIANQLVSSKSSSQNIVWRRIIILKALSVLLGMFNYIPFLHPLWTWMNVLWKFFTNYTMIILSERSVSESFSNRASPASWAGKSSQLWIVIPLLHFVYVPGFWEWEGEMSLIRSDHVDLTQNSFCDFLKHW